MKRKLMLLLACLFVGISLVTAQNQNITGVVISEEDGRPVVGASVLVKGTTQGTITDVDGKMCIRDRLSPDNASDFRFSSTHHCLRTSEMCIRDRLYMRLLYSLSSSSSFSCATGV